MAKKRDRENDTFEDTGNGESGTAMATIPPPKDLGSLVQPQNDAAKAFLDNIKGKREVPKSLPVIQINHQEAQFVLPSGELRAEVAGYPIYYFQTRKYYEKVFQPGSSAPPDCWSADLVKPSPTSTKKQSELCSTCKWNDFGSARDGKSKACGEMTWVFLLNPEFGQPPIAVIVFSPSSIKPLLGTKFKPGYFSRAQAAHGVYEIVWTQFGLEQLGGGVQYCIAAPVMGEAAGPEMSLQIANARNSFIEAMEKLRGQTAAVGEPEA